MMMMLYPVAPALVRVLVAGLDSPVTLVNGQWYLKCAADYYLHEIAPTLPETSGVFVH